MKKVKRRKPPRVKNIKASTITRIAKMRKDGKTWAMIGRKLQWPIHTAYNALRANGGK